MDQDDRNDSIRVLTREDTIKTLGLSRATWERLERRGDVPPKTKLSQNRIGYRVTDVKAWLKDRLVHAKEPARLD